jgi:polysaccharide transporter, PST family
MAARVKRLPPTAWVTFQHIAEQALWLLLFAVQAPILGPKAFGLISIVMVFVGFCEYVVANVATEVLLSIRDVSPQQYSTVTATCLGISAAMGLAMFVSAEPLATLFNDPQVAPITRALAFLPLLSALSSAPTAAIKRDLHFQSTAVRGVTSLVVAGSVSLVLTLSGAGVWALVAQALLQRAVSAVVLWRVAPLRLQLAWSWTHLREMLRLAGKLAVSCVMNWSSAQLPKFILGVWIGLTDLGLFSLAGRLTDILTQIAIDPRASVARVALRNLFNENPDRMAPAVRQMIQQMSVICFPLFVGAAAIVPALFHVWLDARWTGAILPSQLLLLTGVPTVTFYASTAILLASGRQGAEAIVATVQTVSTAVVAAIFAPFGLIAASLGLAARPWAFAALPVYFLRTRARVGLKASLAPQLMPLALSLLMGAAVCALRGPLEAHLEGIPLLATLVAAGVAIYVALVLVAMPGFVGGLTRRSGAAFHGAS